MAVSYNSISREESLVEGLLEGYVRGLEGWRGNAHCLHSPGETWWEMRFALYLLAAGWAARKEDVLVQIERSRVAREGGCVVVLLRRGEVKGG